MWRCRNCKQEVAEKDLVLQINPSGGPLYLCECGGVVDFFTNVPQPKAITGRSSIICECGGSTWVRSQDGVSTCLYCKRQPPKKEQAVEHSVQRTCANCGASDWVRAGFPVSNEYCTNCGAIR